MDIRKIKTLIEMLEASNLNEIEVSQGEESVRISKSSGEIKVLQDSNIGINNESQSINKIDNNQIENEIKGIKSHRQLLELFIENQVLIKSLL